MPSKKLESMTVDELDIETMRLKDEQPARVKDKLREVKAVRDLKVEQERRNDRVKKLLINGAGVDAAQVDQWLKTRSQEDIDALIAPFEAIEDQIGVVVTPTNGELTAEGHAAEGGNG
jgi:hypothetical protein